METSIIVLEVVLDTTLVLLTANGMNMLIFFIIQRIKISGDSSPDVETRTGRGVQVLSAEYG